MTSDWRGTQTAPFLELGNLSSLIDAKANILRYQIARWVDDPAIEDPKDWTYWVRDSLDYLDSHIIPACVGKVKIVLDIHTPPGGTTGGILNLWVNDSLYKAFVSMWEEIAVRYKEKEAPYVFGVLNEPAGPSLEVKTLMLDSYHAIRSVDSSRRVSITCPYSDPSRWSNVPVLNDNRVWYEFHFYNPLKFTHQGIGDYPSGKVYPTPRNNKEKMIKNLAKVLAWQDKYKKRIYVGEVGVSNFCDEDSRVRYLEDFFSLCDSYNWNWTYHAWFGEADVWTPKGKVLNLLKMYWSKNKFV